jgi:hypothetical protein
VTRRHRLDRQTALETYVNQGQLEVFEQIRRDAALLDGEVTAVGPFNRVDPEHVARSVGKTRGAINNLWGSGTQFQNAVIAQFLIDDELGLRSHNMPAPADFQSLEDWIAALAQAELELGPTRHMEPSNSYALRWAVWLTLVPYGIWSERIASSSTREFRLGVARYESELLLPMLSHFDRRLRVGVSIQDLATGIASLVEGFWLSTCLSDDPLGDGVTNETRLTTALTMLINGALEPAS